MNSAHAHIGDFAGSYLGDSTEVMPTLLRDANFLCISGFQQVNAPII